MRKTFLKVSLFSFLALGMSTAFVGCKDYDDDIDQLRTEIAANKTAIEAINQKISQGAILNSVVPTEDGKGIVISVTKDGNTQTYTIKNGENGQDGTTAQVWDIREVDGKAYWFKNGENQNIPAQGKDGVGTTGETGAPGNYWAPNEEGTKLEEYAWNAEAKKYEKTGKSVDIAITVEGDKTPGITAVADANYVYLTGVQTGTDEAGKPVFGTVAISRNGLLRGIVFNPDLYLDGVEGTRYAYADGVYKTPGTGDATGEITVNTTKANFTIPAASNWHYVASTAATDAYQLGENATTSYVLNPNNANIDGVEFSFLPIDNKEQVAVSRGAEAPVPALVVKDKPAMKDGELKVVYNIVNPKSVVYTEDSKNTLPVTALQATLAGKDVDEVITSDLFSLVMATAKFTALSYVPATETAGDVHLDTDGKKAAETASDFVIPYNQDAEHLFDLSTKIRVCYTIADFGKTTTTESQMTLAEAATRWGLTTSYDPMTYYVGTSETDESKYANVAADGKVTLKYIKDGAWVNCGDNEASRSAIGKHPIVRVTLKNGDKVVLVGYVKLEIGDKAAVPPTIANTPIILAEGTLPLLCEAKDDAVVSTWQTTSDKVLAELGLSEAEFKANYTIEGNAATGATYVEGTTANTFVAVTGNTYGNLEYNADSEAGPTNGFLTWDYAVVNAKAIAALEGRKVKLFRKFVNNNDENIILYLGVEISIAAAPSVTFGTLDPVFLATGKTDEVGMRVPQAKNTLGMTVYDFYALLKDYYTDDVIKATYTTTPATGYPTIDKLNVKQAYKFAAATEQMTGLTVSANGLELLSGTETIATIDGTSGQVTYQDGEKAKELLNAGSSDYNVWAKVEITANYGNGCDLPFAALAGNKVRIDFKRPIVLKGAEGYSIYPNGIDPSQEPLGDFFTMKDSYTNPLFVLENNKYVSYKGIYDFYDVATLSIDFSKVAVSGVTFKMMAVEGSDAVVEQSETNAKLYTATISDVDALNDIMVVCDYGNEVLEKDQVVKLPITVAYSWGTQSVEAQVTIKAFPKN